MFHALYLKSNNSARAQLQQQQQLQQQLSSTPHHQHASRTNTQQQQPQQQHPPKVQLIRRAASTKVAKSTSAYILFCNPQQQGASADGGARARSMGARATKHVDDDECSTRKKTSTASVKLKRIYSERATAAEKSSMNGHGEGGVVLPPDRISFATTTPFDARRDRSATLGGGEGGGVDAGKQQLASMLLVAQHTKQQQQQQPSAAQHHSRKKTSFSMKHPLINQHQHHSNERHSTPAHCDDGATEKGPATTKNVTTTKATKAGAPPPNNHPPPPPPNGKKEKQQQQPPHKANLQNKPSLGVGMGIGLMVQQAGMLAGYTAPMLQHPNSDVLRDQIRKAKHEGRTVTILNGYLYIDYQLKAALPANFLLE